MIRATFVITVDCESPPMTLRHLVEQGVEAELAKKKHRLGEVQVHTRKAGDVEAAALAFASAIEQSGRDAVNERIR